METVGTVPPKSAFRRIFARIKWPGWLTILFAIYSEVPDQQGRIEYWFDAAKALKGHVGLFAQIVTSRYFSIGLFIVGIVYVLLAGEVEKPIRRRELSIVGWTAIGLIALAFWSVMIAGYIATHLSQNQTITPAQLKNLTDSNSQLKQQVIEQHAQIDRLQQRSVWRSISDAQRDRLSNVIGKAPSIAGNYRLVIDILPNCDECLAFASDMIATWQGLGTQESYMLPPPKSKLLNWTVRGDVNGNLNMRLTGVVLPVEASNCPPVELNWILLGLDAADVAYSLVDISPEAASKVGYVVGECHIIVGSNP